MLILDKPDSPERRAAKQPKPESVLATCMHCSKEFCIPKNRTQGKDRRCFCSIACANRASVMLQKEIKLQLKTKFPRTPQELTALHHSLDINQHSF